MVLWRRRATTPTPVRPAATPPGDVSFTRNGVSPPFAVIDVETTGLRPSWHDRIVEIAVLRTDPHSGEIVDSIVTLVNPQRDIGPTHIHGIRTAAILDAPTFADIAGDVLDMVDGAVLVGHNLRFDWLFLHAELSRAGGGGVAWPGICTLELAGRYHDGPGRRLAQCCAAAGIAVDGWHSAAVDADATRALFFSYLDRARRLGVNNLDGLGCRPLLWPRVARRPSPTGRRHCRDDVPATPPSASFLTDLVARLPNDSDQPAEITAYFELLDRVLEDRRVTADEAEALAAIAADWGISRSAAKAAHRSYLHALASVAYADGILSDVERDDLVDVAALLGLTVADLDVAILRSVEQIGTTASPAASPVGPTIAPGSTVCFTGALLGSIDGEAITRAQAQELAANAGLVNAERVTKSLDVLVIADPDSQSGKARKAREYGTRIVAEAAFWNAIGVSTD